MDARNCESNFEAYRSVGTNCFDRHPQILIEAAIGSCDNEFIFSNATIRQNKKDLVFNILFKHSFEFKLFADLDLPGEARLDFDEFFGDFIETMFESEETCILFSR